MWDFNLKCMDNVDFKGKRVLDIGCRDGLFSFEAEKRGASEIMGIDNNISKGSVELLIPFLKSKVRMQELNVYELLPEKHGTFDIILFFGVLYHLRFPFLSLQKIANCLSEGGLLLIESGMLNVPTLANKDLLYCPVEESPYDPTACTFFNAKGLCSTMRSFNFQLLEHRTFDFGIENPIIRKWKELYIRIKFNIKNMLYVNREFFIFKKDTLARKGDEMLHAGYNLKKQDIEDYWFGTHRIHSRGETGTH